ncbi:MAG: hypothetical protein LUF92_15240, partial [Clostridiales bacterium]|nr:hypothetical protein [Clostridiales bacterium]
SINCSIYIQQKEVRCIEIISEKEVLVDILFDVCQNLEKLLMIFEGRFLPISELRFYDSEDCSCEELKKISDELLERRLDYYNSADYCSCQFNKLINFDKVLSDDIFQKWICLEKELDIALNLMFYSLSTQFATVDLRCAYLIEMAETMIEVVNTHWDQFPFLNPGSRDTTLYDCLEGLIEQYGKIIFQEETESGKDYLRVLINSRVRIMHIKRKQRKLYLSGSESILFSLKIFLMYRCIFLKILGIDENDFVSEEKEIVRVLNGWNSVLTNFLNRIK